VSLSYVRNYYRVPAYRGDRIEYDGGDPHDGPQLGTITGAKDGRIRVRFDGQKRPVSLHPTWHVTYLSRNPPSKDGDPK
jgi:hypothetical protein